LKGIGEKKVTQILGGGEDGQGDLPLRRDGNRNTLDRYGNGRKNSMVGIKPTYACFIEKIRLGMLSKGNSQAALPQGGGGKDGEDLRRNREDHTQGDRILVRLMGGGGKEAKC